MPAKIVALTTALAKTVFKVMSRWFIFRFFYVFDASKTSILAAIYGECGGNYAGVRGHLASPGFPFKDYPADQNCEWIIEVPTNLFVEVSNSGDAHFAKTIKGNRTVKIDR